MKTINRFSMIMAIILLSFSLNSCKQTNKTITLHVNTDSINQQNIDSTCNFGQLPGVPNKEFTLDVKFGDKIIWEGVSSSPGKDKVKIRKIQYESGAEVLTKKVKSNSWFSRKVRGKVNKKDNFDFSKGDQEKYLIEFEVFHKGTKETFIIDPKLRILR